MCAARRSDRVVISRDAMTEAGRALVATLLGILSRTIVNAPDDERLAQLGIVELLGDVELLAVLAELIGFCQLSGVAQLALRHQAAALPVSLDGVRLSVRVLLLVLFPIRVEILRLAAIIGDRHLLFVLL